MMKVVRPARRCLAVVAVVFGCVASSSPAAEPPTMNVIRAGELALHVDGKDYPLATLEAGMVLADGTTIHAVGSPDTLGLACPDGSAYLIEGGSLRQVKEPTREPGGGDPVVSRRSPPEPPPAETPAWRGVAKGNVTDAKTGEPIPEGEVVLTRPDNAESTPSKGTVKPDGSFEIPGLTPGTYAYTVKPKCHETQYGTVVVGPGAPPLLVQAPSKPLLVTHLFEFPGLSPEMIREIEHARRYPASFYQASQLDPAAHIISRFILADDPAEGPRKVSELRQALDALAEQAGGKGATAEIDWFELLLPHGNTGRVMVTIRVSPASPRTGAVTPDGGAPSACVDDLPRTTSTPEQTPGSDSGSSPKVVRSETELPREGQGAAGPDDPLYASRGSWGQPYEDQWALRRIGLTPLDDPGSAWNALGPRPAPVVVAVLDSGCDLGHPELAGRLWVNPWEVPGNGVDDDRNGYVDDVHGWNFVDRNANLADANGHGTVNAGIIAAAGGNGAGIAGVNPLARIMVVKVLDFELAGGSARLAEAIYYAARNGARVINVSVGGAGISWVEQEAVAFARERGAVVVAAAGNEGVDTAGFSPAGLAGVLTVAATDTADRRANFSNWGQQVQVAAPGVDVLSLRAAGTDLLVLSGPPGYVPGTAVVGADRRSYRVTGTSFAAPLVAGVASLLFSRRPTLTGEQVTRMILGSARDVDFPGWDQYTGHGLVDARRALDADPDFHALAKIARVGPAREGGRVVVEVRGTALSSEFDGARVELGAGEAPAKWRKVAKVGSPVQDGVLASIEAKEFKEPGRYTVRLVLETKRHGTREARGAITIK